MPNRGLNENGYSVTRRFRALKSNWFVHICSPDCLIALATSDKLGKRAYPQKPPKSRPWWRRSA